MKETQPKQNVPASPISENAGIDATDAGGDETLRAKHPKKGVGGAGSKPVGEEIVEWLKRTNEIQRLLLKNWKSTALCVGALAAAIATVAKVPTDYRWLGYVVAFVLLAIPVLSIIFPGIAAWKRKKRLEKEGVSGVPTMPDFFRLFPYEREDIEVYARRYKRADGVEDKVLKWLQQSDQPLLYLNGPSGAGKTSLLEAFVLPQLQQEIPPVHVIRLRSFGDPVEALVTALRKPGQFWDQRPPKAPETSDAAGMRTLLKAATGRLNGARLLVVFDQFEELLIINDEDAQRVAAVKALLQLLVREPVDALTVILCFRTDYESLLEKLGLPLFDQDNHRSVGAFDRRDSRDFLKQSGIVKDGVLEDVITEASEIEKEERPGLIRPIVLNLFGLALADSNVSLQFGRTYAASRILREYLRNCLSAATVRDHARKILLNKRAPMITSEGTKRPCRVDDLADATGFSRNEVAGCLLRLHEKGLVRCVDRTSNLWEVSHDFVARLLGQLLAG